MVRFSAALLKVASRCNLDCDYCYVYKHADQSWREQPTFISESTIEQFSKRLKEYVKLHAMSEFSITFHGGEPLLYGTQKLVHTCEIIRNIVGPEVLIDFSLQTNGTLLNVDVVKDLESANIGISLSLDGPKATNDRHRLDHGGKSTFDSVLEAINLLNERKSPIFRGVIAVIDPYTSAKDLFSFFAPLNLPRLDFLLPDATHSKIPTGRNESNDLYVNWLREALRVWFKEYPSLPIRWFDALLASRLGVPSPTDAMGLGNVSLIVIDTNGNYTDHDVFKITQNGAASLDRNVFGSSFEEISQHATILQHSFRLTLEGLSQECQTCPVVEACGGGSVMHRWHPARGLNSPSIYCRELFLCLQTSTELIVDSLNVEVKEDYVDIILPLSDKNFVEEAIRWRAAVESSADQKANINNIAREDSSAAAILMMDRYNISNLSHVLTSGKEYGKWLGSINVQPQDHRLVAPFLDTIRVNSLESEQVHHGFRQLERVAKHFSALNPWLLTSFSSLITDILFVESTVDSVDSIFSFSDDTAPNVLYVSSFVSQRPMDADDLGDSLLHEFLHQVLYQMERDGPMLFDHVYPSFPAPWRKGLRPSGGFLHGTFVFSGLTKYWESLANSTMSSLDRNKAKNNASRFKEQALYGIQSLRQFALLTKRGKKLVDQLSISLNLPLEDMMAPGNIDSNCYL